MKGDVEFCNILYVNADIIPESCEVREYAQNDG